MVISTKIQSFNLYVGPRPLTLLDVFPTPLPQRRPHWVYTVSRAGRGAANEAVSSTDAGLGDGRVLKLATPPHFHLCSLDSGFPPDGRLLSTSFVTFR